MSRQGLRPNSERQTTLTLDLEAKNIQGYQWLEDCTNCGGMLPAVSAASSARITMLSCSSAAHRSRSRANAAAKASARPRVACAYATDAACCARLRRLLPRATGVLQAVLGLCRATCASARNASGLSPGFRVYHRWTLMSWQFGHCTAPRNDLTRAVIEDFTIRLVPVDILIYAGDTGEKWGHFDAPLLAGLRVNVAPSRINRPALSQSNCSSNTTSCLLRPD
jgi:hypothetical protein